MPNHTTPYWSESYPLYVAPTITSVTEMTPTRIDTFGRDNSASLTVSAGSNLASYSIDTQLGSTGIVVGVVAISITTKKRVAL